MFGFVSQDSIRIGDGRIHDQDFGEVLSERGPRLVDAAYDGILGLGLEADAINGMVPPFYNMIAQAVLKEPVFGIHLAKRNSTASSEITFGGFDDGHYDGEIIKIPLRRKSHWEVEFSSIATGNQSVDLEGTGAIFDTGTPMIFLPTALATIM